MPTLAVIVASTRPGRVGLPVAQWFRDRAVAHARFEVDFVDLAEVALPMLDEPHHPRLRKYTKPHTLDWSRRMDAADAFVLVTPEYNHGMPAPLKNALDYLSQEWAHKPVGFVSYGGVSGGLRSVQMTKQVLACLRMFPAGNAVALPFVHGMLDDERRLEPPEPVTESADAMLDELVTLHGTLSGLRS